MLDFQDQVCRPGDGATC